MSLVKTDQMSGAAMASGMLRRMLHVSLVVLLIVGALTPFFAVRKWGTAGQLGLLLFCALASLYLLKRGRVRLAAAAWLAGIWCFLLSAVILSRGIASPVLMALIGVPLISYCLLGRRVALWISGCVALSVCALAILAAMGVRLPAYFPYPPVPTLWAFLAILVLAMVPLDVLLRGLQDSLELARRKEAEARASESKYRDLFERANDLIWVQDLDERLTAVNETALRLLQYTRDEAIGKPVLDLVMPEFHQLLKDRLVLQLRGEDLPPVEYCIHARDGRPLWVESTSRLIRDEQGRPIGLHGIARDITERKRAELEKAIFQAHLHQAQKLESMGRLAGGVAHDFNNLLTVINGYSQLLLRRLDAGDPLRDTLEQIHRAGERAAGLTRQLLAFSRTQVLQPRVLDLHRVLEEMRPMLEQVMGEDVEVRVSLAAENATVQADPQQLEQVIVNLAVNAREAMPNGGIFLIETARVERDDVFTQSHPDAPAGPWVTLTVTDSGAGMDEAVRQRIFEPFFTTRETGTGLGLSIVAGIVGQSRGYIDVCSEPGVGTTFNIRLPALSEVAPEATVLPETAVPGGNETVLVVEDQTEVRGYAASVLGEYGYRVIAAKNADEALLLCERERAPIQLLLTDVVMPGLSGRGLANRLEKLRPGIKVIFMSGYTDDVILRHGVLKHGVPLIEKPFSPQELAGRVRAVLDPPPRPACVLVADDEADVRGFLRTALQQAGYQVIEAANGKHVLRQVRATRVDLLITDLVMPEREGLETIRALRRDMPSLRIIAISGAYGGRYLKIAERLGADAVLSKPMSPELLLARVAAVLKLRR